jgi:phage tail sheath protein FI
VKCDADTMTQDHLHAGRLVVLVGFAALRPAEFVLIRIEKLLAR